MSDQLQLTEQLQSALEAEMEATAASACPTCKQPTIRRFVVYPNDGEFKRGNAVLFDAEGDLSELKNHICSKISALDPDHIQIHTLIKDPTHGYLAAKITSANELENGDQLTYTQGDVEEVNFPIKNVNFSTGQGAELVTTWNNLHVLQQIYYKKTKALKAALKSAHGIGRKVTKRNKTLMDCIKQWDLFSTLAAQNNWVTRNLNANAARHKVLSEANKKDPAFIESWENKTGVPNKVVACAVACEQKLAAEGPRQKKAAGGRPKKPKNPPNSVSAVNKQNMELGKLLSNQNGALQGLSQAHLSNMANAISNADFRAFSAMPLLYHHLPTPLAQLTRVGIAANLSAATAIAAASGTAPATATSTAPAAGSNHPPNMPTSAAFPLTAASTAPMPPSAAAPHSVGAPSGSSPSAINVANAAAAAAAAAALSGQAPDGSNLFHLAEGGDKTGLNKAVAAAAARAAIAAATAAASNGVPNQAGDLLGKRKAPGPPEDQQQPKANKTGEEGGHMEAVTEGPPPDVHIVTPQSAAAAAVAAAAAAAQQAQHAHMAPRHLSSAMPLGSLGGLQPGPTQAAVAAAAANAVAAAHVAHHAAANGQEQ